MAIEFSADEVYEMGMDIERNGEAYYRKAAALSKDEKVRGVFTDLMKQEQQHYQTFKALREKLPPKTSLPTVADPEGEEQLYLDALVKSRLFNSVHEAESLASKVSSAHEALKAALSFEKDTVLFFQMMKGMTEERLGKSEIDRLIEEEHGHIVRIAAAIREIAGKGPR
ncbi:MAG TPA: ferritin family protein [Candidatus Bathyarchaeia archaeon]|nr:ferritin family protein [Candidatus Bathyarchaeia archaeon]